jgi:hypothetical protein
MRSVILGSVMLLLVACEGGVPYETAFEATSTEVAEGCERFCADTIVGDDVYLACDVRTEQDGGRGSGNEGTVARIVCKYRTPYRPAELH